MEKETNDKNIESLVKIIPNFYLEKESEEYLVDAVTNLTETGIKVDAQLGLTENRRVFYPVEVNEGMDKAYRKYTDMLYTNYKSIPELKDSDGCITQAYYRYDAFKEGMYTDSKGIKSKLFKKLLKLGVPKEEIEQITTARNTKTKMFLCISRNPVDYLFCSTNQSFTSCISLDSDYSDAIYMGLPGIMDDNARCMLFLTTGKLRTHMIKGNEFKHFRLLERCWGILTQDGKLNFDRMYPSDNLGLKDKLRLVRPDIEVQDGGDYKTNKSECIRNVDGELLHIYLDYFGISVITDTFNYTSDGSSGRNHIHTGYEYSNGFEELGDYEDIKYGGDTCYHCGNRAGEDYDGVYIDEVGWHCESCVNTYLRWCDSCDVWHLKDDCRYVESARAWRCNTCIEEHYFECTDCSELFNQDNVQYDNHGDHICDSCHIDNYFTCTECEDICTNTDIKVCVDGDKYCSDCFEALELVDGVYVAPQVPKVRRYGKFAEGDKVMYNEYETIVRGTMYKRDTHSDWVLIQVRGHGHQGCSETLDDGRITSDLGFNDVYWVQDRTLEFIPEPVRLTSDMLDVYATDVMTAYAGMDTGRSTFEYTAYPTIEPEGL